MRDRSTNMIYRSDPSTLRSCDVMWCVCVCVCVCVLGGCTVSIVNITHMNGLAGAPLSYTTFVGCCHSLESSFSGTTLGSDFLLGLSEQHPRDFVLPKWFNRVSTNGSTSVSLIRSSGCVFLLCLSLMICAVMIRLRLLLSTSKPSTFSTETARWVQC